MARDPRITMTCRAHFGVYRGHGKWSPSNNCDGCPLRQPCLDHGHRPAHTHEQLAASVAQFEAESVAILDGAA